MVNQVFVHRDYIRVRPILSQESLLWVLNRMKQDQLLTFKPLQCTQVSLVLTRKCRLHQWSPLQWCILSHHLVTMRGLKSKRVRVQRQGPSNRVAPFINISKSLMMLQIKSQATKIKMSKDPINPQLSRKLIGVGLAGDQTVSDSNMRHTVWARRSLLKITKKRRQAHQIGFRSTLQIYNK